MKTAHVSMIPARTLRCVFVGLFCAAVPVTAIAQSGPGDLFREYRWTNEHGDCSGALRVGGQLDYGGGPIQISHEIDLDHATRAEIVVEKVLCHDGTRGLAVSLNDHPWIKVPDPPTMPDPPSAFQHHTCCIVALPIAQLQADTGNQFRMKVDAEHPWNWPQNLIYGVHLRVYYDTDKKSHPTGRIVRPSAGSTLGINVLLQAEADDPDAHIKQVDFIGCFEDVNLEGDGRYTRWHYRYDRGQFVGHIGTATESPWMVKWDTSWIPDQDQPLRFSARLTDNSGLTFVTPEIGGLTMDRGNLSVELCKPYDVPKKWVTRSGAHEEHFAIRGNLAKARHAQLVWHSWSPGYMNGIYINDQKVFDCEGPRYAPYVHRVELDDLSMFRAGENTLKTGETPKRNGKMVHGMEVNWPGIMVLIQYDR